MFWERRGRISKGPGDPLANGLKRRRERGLSGGSLLVCSVSFFQRATLAFLAIPFLSVCFSLNFFSAVALPFLIGPLSALLWVPALLGCGCQSQRHSKALGCYQFQKTNKFRAASGWETSTRAQQNFERDVNPWCPPYAVRLCRHRIRPSLRTLGTPNKFPCKLIRLLLIPSVHRS